MKVSIIIPVYNVCSQISNCLCSVFAQTFRDFEVIIIDDCGDDNSIEIARGVIEEQKKEISVRIIKHTTNRGLSAARNTGLFAANGEYVLFLDGDDVISCRCLDYLVEPLSRFPYQMIVGDFEASIDDAKYNHNRILGEIIGQKENITSYCHEQYYSMAWNKLVSRQFLLKNNLFFKESLIHEDELWSFEVACNLKEIFLIDQVTYYYLIREGSIQQDANVQKHEVAILEVICEMIKYAEKVDLFYNKSIFSFLYWYIVNNFCLWEQSNSQDTIRYRYSQIKKCMPNHFHRLLIHDCSFRQYWHMFHYQLPSSIGFKYFFRKFHNCESGF